MRLHGPIKVFRREDQPPDAPRTIWINPPDESGKHWISIGGEEGGANYGWAYLTKKTAKELGNALLYLSSVLESSED